MSPEPVPGACSLNGTVIETFESEGKTVLRLAVTGGCVDVCVGPGEGAHLGECLRLEGDLRVKNLSVQPDHPGPGQLVHGD